MKKEQNKKVNSSIRCDVDTCVHNDCDKNYCKLNEIKVSSHCGKNEVLDMDETICSSYEKN